MVKSYVGFFGLKNRLLALNRLSFLKFKTLIFDENKAILLV